MGIRQENLDKRNPLVAFALRPPHGPSGLSQSLTPTLARLARVFCWSNPLVPLAARMLPIERERACDDLLAASFQTFCPARDKSLLFARGQAGRIRRKPGKSSLSVSISRSSSISRVLRIR